MEGPRIGVLGPLVVAHPEGYRSLRGRVARVLLARLVIGPGAVSVDELADSVWGETLPASVGVTLKSHMSRLRGTLRQAVGYDPIASYPGGYRLAVPAAEVDAARFEAAVTAARSLPAPEAGKLLRDALSLWRGPAFGDLRYEGFAAGEAARLEELRLAALEASLDADLRSGRSGDVLAELAALVVQYPLRSGLVGLHMQALDSVGRQREALHEYDRYRSSLVDESGLDPAPQLTALRDAILAGRARPGIGLSDPPPGGRAPTTQEWADAALAVAEHAGLERFAVMGTGWSTPAALAMAATHPQRVSAVIVFNGFARFVRAHDYPIGIPPELIDRFRESVLDTTSETMPSELDDVILHAPSRADDPQFRNWWRRSGQRGATPAASRAHFSLLLDADVRRLLPRITQPTLVLQRVDNRYVRADHGRYLAEHIPQATYHELAGADQLLASGDPRPVIEAVRAFLGRHLAS